MFPLEFSIRKKIKLKDDDALSFFSFCGFKQTLPAGSDPQTAQLATEPFEQQTQSVLLCSSALHYDSVLISQILPQRAEQPVGLNHRSR